MTHNHIPTEVLLGSKLVRTIYSQNGTVLLNRDTILEKQHLDTIDRLGILVTNRDVIVPNQHSTDEKPTPTNTEFIDTAIAQVRDIFRYVKECDQIPIADVHRTIIPAVQSLASNEHIMRLFLDLKEKDDYTHIHTIAVGAIATLIGKWLNFDDKDLMELTVAATLHDIGKAKVPGRILSKPGKLTQEEYDCIKQHTVFGYDLIKNTFSLSYEHALVALQHHEREDGSGYPFGLLGDQVHPYSKIVAVADVFHAMGSSRVYQKAIPLFQILKEMSSGVFGKLDPAVGTLFIKKIMECLISYEVVLSDGRTGSVIMINTYDPIYPVIRTSEGIIDLSLQKDIYVSSISL